MAVRDPLVTAAASHQLTATERRAEAERLLGHRFADGGLVLEALTHRSAAQGRGRRRGAGSNERLEFVGDRVLGLLVAEWLIERFPQEQEGELGRRYAQLVSRPVLAAIGEELGVVPLIALAANEVRAGVGGLANTVADAMEALLGAVYLDGGLDAGRRFVRGAWASRMDGQKRPPTDPKTALQEWLMGRGRPLPRYAVTQQTGPSHAPAFAVTVTAGELSGEGVAGSKWRSWGRRTRASRRC
jgi:ribonuclease III